MLYGSKVKAEHIENGFDFIHADCIFALFEVANEAFGYQRQLRDVLLGEVHGAPLFAGLCTDA
ncbi:Uncharacterised protein [Corynebacterium renale]|nr:Uncharacterised protein [Corynebacterium renale]STD00397.1 Uncharacterised protein [Corynebacterium renale]